MEDLFPVCVIFAPFRDFGGMERRMYDCHSGNKQAKADAKAWLLDMWRVNKDLGKYIISRATNDTFLAVAHACKSHGGNNNWTG
jgi:hypothetical protein